jgi:hypothetical protein
MTFGDGMGCGPVRRTRHSPRRRPGLRPGMKAPCQELADGETQKGVFPQSAARKDKSRDGAPEGVGGRQAARSVPQGTDTRTTQRRPALHPPRVFRGKRRARPARPAPRPCIGVCAALTVRRKQGEETMRVRHRPSADPHGMKAAARWACSLSRLRGRVGEGPLRLGTCGSPSLLPPPQAGEGTVGLFHRPHFLPSKQREAGVARRP